MNKSKLGMAVSLIAALAVGAISGIVYAGEGTPVQTLSRDTSSLPGGGMKIPHNERLHLSTDQKWVYSEGHLSDLIRLQWTEDRAKPAISWVDEQGRDKTAIISHAKANNPEQADHNHLSIETTMSPDGEYANQLFTRLEIPFDQDVAEIRTHSSNFNVVDGLLRIAGSDGMNRDIQFANTDQGNVTAPRWSLRADPRDEQGGDSGSDFHIIRYSDAGEAIDSPIFIDRKSGNVGIGNTDASAKLDVNGDRIRLRDSMTPTSSTAAGSTGEISWDKNYLYICVGDNRWKRVPLETF